MPTARELFGDHTLQTLQLAGLPTGLMTLDHLTHGMLPGALWVIAATPGAGRTTLACHLVRQVATNGGSAALVSARDERAELLTNLLASQAKVPARDVQQGELSEVESQRLASAMAHLAEVDLRLLSPVDREWVYSDGAGVADFSSLMTSDRRVADLLVVDDLDLWLGSGWIHALQSLRAWSRQRRFALIVTVPAEGVAAGDGCHPDLRRHADVVIRLGLPGQFDLDGCRGGEANLDVLRNRQGPQARVTVRFEGHYRRFADS